MTTLVLSLNTWDSLRSQLMTDYGPTIFISFITKKKLGFIIRYYSDNTSWEDYGVNKRDVRLDFYDEKRKTMFLLKYSELLR